VTREQQEAIKAAMTALATSPAYSGAVIVLFSSEFRDCQMSTASVNDELADRALEALLGQRRLSRSPIVVPADYRNREQRRRDDG
jgi:hypothetical protein